MNGGRACLPCSLVTDLRKYKLMIFASVRILGEFFRTRYRIAREKETVYGNVRSPMYDFSIFSGY